MLGLVLTCISSFTSDSLRSTGETPVGLQPSSCQRQSLWTEEAVTILIRAVRDAYTRLDGKLEKRDSVWRDIFAVISPQVSRICCSLDAGKAGLIPNAEHMFLNYKSLF